MSSDSTTDETSAREETSLRGIILKTAIFTVVVVAMIAVAGYFFRQPLTTLAVEVVERVGLVGIFAGVFAADAFTFPVPPDTYIFVGIASDATIVPVLGTISVASVLAGNLAYWIGPYLGRVPLLRERIARFREKGELLFGNYGVWAVGIAALTPVPFSVVCWFAGIYRMKYGPFAVATLMRIPRILGYYWLYKVGWAPPVVEV